MYATGVLTVQNRVVSRDQRNKIGVALGYSVRFPMRVKPVHLIFCCGLLLSCSRKNEGNGHPGFIFLSGRYIGREVCLENPDHDYHLIEIISPRNVGDSIVFEGSPYGHVVKAKGIKSDFQVAGRMIGFDANLSTNRVTASSCARTPSLTYPLYEMIIIDQIPFR